MTSFSDLLCPIGGDIFEDPIVVPCCNRAFSRGNLRSWFLQGVQTCPLCRVDLGAYNVETEPRNLTIAGLAETVQLQAIPQRPKNHLWSADLRILPNGQIGELTLAIRDSKFTVQPSLFIAVIDNSGSMSGAAFNQVKTALLHIVGMAQYNPSVIIKFVIYNSFANVVALTGQPEQDRQTISALRAEGGTNFSEAFRAIRTVLFEHRTRNIDSAAVAFLTDGQDGSGKTRDVLASDLRDILSDGLAYPVSVHALGFSAGCDRVFLENLLGCGTLPGTFRYSEPGDNDDALCQKLTGVFEICSRQSSVQIDMTGLATVFSGNSFRFPVDSKGWGRYQCWVKVDGSSTVHINSTCDVDVELQLVCTQSVKGDRTYEKWLSTLSDDAAAKILELPQYQAEPEEAKGARTALLLKYLKEIDEASLIPETKSRTAYMRTQIAGWSAGQQLSLGRLGDMRFSTLFGNKLGAGAIRSTQEPTKLTYPAQAVIADVAAFERHLKCYSRNNTGSGRNILQEAICRQTYGEVIADYTQAALDAMIPEDMEHLDNDGNNAIMLASYCGHTAVLQVLVKQASIDTLNKCNSDGESAVTLAIKKRGFHKSLMVLVGAGAVMPSHRKKALERYCIDNKYTRTAALLQQIGDTVTYDIDETMSEDYIRYVYGQAKASDSVCKEQYLSVFLAKVMPQEAQEMIDMGAQATVDILNKYCIPPKPDHPETERYLDMAKMLLKAYPHFIYQKDQDAETPLHAATRKGSLPHVKYFLALGRGSSRAHIDTVNDKGNSALAVAVNLRFPCIVEELLTNGASVFLKNNKGNTPLYGACERGPLKVAEKLISYGAEIETLNDNGDTTILICCRNGQSEVLQYLLQYVDMEFVDRKAHIDGFNAIMACAEADRANCITVLKDYGVDLSQKTSPDNKIIAGATPLHIAAYYGRNNALAELLRLGVDPNIRDLNGSTALHIATLQGYGETIQALLRAGANSAIADAAGNTPLSYCRDRAEIKEFFIDPVTETLIRMAKGAYSNLSSLIEIFKSTLAWHWPHGKLQFDVRDEDGNTALFYAAVTSNIAMAELLLLLGADANITDREGCSPLYWSLHNKVTRLSKLLQQHSNAETISMAASQYALTRGAGPLCFLGAAPPPYHITSSTIAFRMNNLINQIVPHYLRRDVPAITTGGVMHNLTTLPEFKELTESRIWWESKVLLTRKVALGQNKLSPEQCIAVCLYSNNKVVPALLNNADGKCAELMHQYNNMLYTALQSLPAYNGETFLGSAEVDRRLFMKGTEFTWPRFVSSSTLWRVAMENTPSYISKARRGTIFAIQSKTGKSIAPYSQYPYDAEVVFLPGTRFKVTNWYHGTVIALGQANIREHSYSVKEQDDDWLPLAEMISSDKSLIIELTEL